MVRVHTKYVPATYSVLSSSTRARLSSDQWKLLLEKAKGLFFIFSLTKGITSIDGGLSQSRGKQQKDMNLSFVYRADFKEYGIGAQILRDLGVRKMRLLTNNRKHLVGLRGYGLEVTSLEAIPRDTPLREVAKPKKTKARSA